MQFSTQYWRAATGPGAARTATVWLFENDPALSGVTVWLEFTNAGGTVLPATPSALSGDTPSYRAISIGPAIAPSGTTNVRLVVRATATAGAQLHIDEASITRGPIPTPTAATPVSEPIATATATATATAAATRTPTATATRTTTPSPTASRTPTPTFASQRVHRIARLRAGGAEDGHGGTERGEHIESGHELGHDAEHPPRLALVLVGQHIHRRHPFARATGLRSAR